MASSADKTSDVKADVSNGVGGGSMSATRTTNDSHIPTTSQNAKQTQSQILTNTTSGLSSSASAANSAKSSRETSPVRPPPKSTVVSTPRSTRSRKNSQELSPTRVSSGPGLNVPSVPSAAAVQRALSAANKPQLPHSGIDSSIEGSRQDKNPTSRSGESIPHWPVSPRLKSPPPPMSSSRNSVPSPRKPEHDATPPNTSMKRIAAASAPDLHASTTKSDADNDDIPTRSGIRTPARGASGGSTLETVQESSLPATPAIGRLSYSARPGDEGRPEKIEENPMEDAFSKNLKITTESGSESGGNKSSGTKSEKPPASATLSRPTTVLPKRSHTSLNLAGAKAGGVDGSVRNMTVETETVSSIPQVSLGGGAGERGVSGRKDQGGSVRLNPSNETIRPKKEKKKPVRKPTSLNAGTVSSKADIFEAKVANAVDEANSSDSEETFVYESNPAESQSRPHRYHSRTPSATSMASQIDPHGTRSRQSLKDSNHGVAGKRSMKFTNNTYSNNLKDEFSNQDSGKITPKPNGASHTPRHHHIGRYGRGGVHPSLFDSESPFTQASKQQQSPRTSAGNATRLPRPGSPRNPPNFRSSPTTKKLGETYAYDFDGEGADDERTPLVGSFRINRSRHGRRPNSGSLRQIEYMEQRQKGCFSRYGACIVVSLLLLILISGAAAFVVALTKPLMEVSVKHIQNVLASEQEIMLDLDVRATNPNLFAITVNDMDVNIFAKSRFVGSDSFWRDRSPHPSPRIEGRRRRRRMQKAAQSASLIADPAKADSTFHIADGIDEGNDPIEDPEGDPQTMLLGRIFEFDSPLIFDASPLKRRSTSSVGEVRLAKPGNKTEEGGSVRWEKVLQHPFDLIVRGVIKYQLPLSSRMRSASIGGSVKVFPKDDGVDEKDPGNTN